MLSTLESGVYSLEIWSSARESDGLRTEIELALSTDTIANITTATALLNGIIDNNSIEMQDAAGNITVYRLSEDVKTYIESIPENEKVTIKYYEENGQLIITSIIVD
ncbi:hypothetical protein H1D32_05065 [Anaerobacillus sp. CMMVII]|uniref:hypothetical protein n=1 Tax=Anaerobacillus sp. CMMVII TaxID=2755588 RepID=UPI0021B7F46A|nr:hypothetical protein [Anaerobacillus sp. CMMVII]MCT8137165.1 hypothetical protein [Anaerobacillus sp. CMMVII]